MYAKLIKFRGEAMSQPTKNQTVSVRQSAITLIGGTGIGLVLGTIGGAVFGDIAMGAVVGVGAGAASGGVALAFSDEKTYQK